MHDTPQPPAAPDAYWHAAIPVTDPRRGYLQQLDETGLAAWAAAHRTELRLLIRPGDYVFPGATIAVAAAPAEGVEAAIRSATAVGGQRVSSGDLEFAVRQLVEVGVRALSPGINDPHTAMSVQDRLGAALCDAAPLHLSKGVTLHDDRAVLFVPAIDYGGLVDAMFHMLRQNAAGSTAVLAHQLDVLTAVAGCERDPERLAELGRHADLVLSDAEQDISTSADLEDVRIRHRRFVTVRRHGSLGLLHGDRPT